MGALVDRSVPRMPGMVRIAPTLTTGFDGATRMMSASAIASVTSGAAWAFSAPMNAKLWVGTWAEVAHPPFLEVDRALTVVGGIGDDDVGFAAVVTGG